MNRTTRRFQLVWGTPAIARVVAVSQKVESLSKINYQKRPSSLLLSWPLTSISWSRSEELQCSTIHGNNQNQYSDKMWCGEMWRKFDFYYIWYDTQLVFCRLLLNWLEQDWTSNIGEDSKAKTWYIVRFLPQISTALFSPLPCNQKMIPQSNIRRPSLVYPASGCWIVRNILDIINCSFNCGPELFLSVVF